MPKTKTKASKKAKKSVASKAPEAPETTQEEQPEVEVPKANPETTKGKKTSKKVVTKSSWPEGFVPTGDKVADTKTILDHAPKVSFMVPLGEGEKPGSEETVQINGYKYTMKKGHMVEIPKPVANLLANKYKVEMEVAQRAQAHATPEKSAALTP